MRRVRIYHVVERRPKPAAVDGRAWALIKRVGLVQHRVSKRGTVLGLLALFAERDATVLDRHRVALAQTARAIRNVSRQSAAA